MRRRTLTDPRFDLDATGDVRFGAYARRQFRRRLAAGVFGGLLVIAAGGLFWTLYPAAATPAAGSYRVSVRCSSCGRDALLAAQVGQRFPAQCPACGETAARELWQCRACGERFVWSSAAGTVRCPRCASDQVGSAGPAAP